MNSLQETHLSLEAPEIRRKVPTEGHELWSAQRLRGRLEMVFDLLTPLHIGGPAPVPAGELGFPAGAGLVRPFYRQEGIPLIPAASIKGAVRALTEMFTYSCPVTNAQKRCRGPAYCLACRVFGALGRQGQWFFSDGLLYRPQGQKGTYRRIWSLPPQYSGQTRVQGDLRRYYPHRPATLHAQGSPVEVLVLGKVAFRVQAHFYNLTAAELGAVLITLGQGNPPLCPKLGGGKNAGLGAVRIRIKDYTLWRGEQLLTEPLWKYIQKARAADFLDHEALTRLEQDLGCYRLRKGETP